MNLRYKFFALVFGFLLFLATEMHKLHRLIWSIRLSTHTIHAGFILIRRAVRLGW